MRIERPRCRGTGGVSFRTAGQLVTRVAPMASSRSWKASTNARGWPRAHTMCPRRGC